MAGTASGAEVKQEQGQPEATATSTSTPTPTGGTVKPFSGRVEARQLPAGWYSTVQSAMAQTKIGSPIRPHMSARLSVGDASTDQLPALWSNAGRRVRLCLEQMATPGAHAHSEAQVVPVFTSSQAAPQLSPLAVPAPNVNAVVHISSFDSPRHRQLEEVDAEAGAGVDAGAGAGLLQK